jgi:hypothetical protein
MKWSIDFLRQSFEILHIFFYQKLVNFVNINFLFPRIRGEYFIFIPKISRIMSRRGKAVEVAEKWFL